MIASLAALALLSAPLRQFPKVTASTLSTLTLVLAAVLAQVYVLLALPLRNNINIRTAMSFQAYGCFL
jgi:hypothetical protein